MNLLYLDENMPKHLADGFEILQKPEGLKTGVPISVRHLTTEFHNGIKDIEWIPELGRKNACILTQDIHIQRRKHELELYRAHQLGIFFLRGTNKKTGLSIWQMVAALAHHWPAITRIILEQNRPFAFELKPKGSPKSI